MKLRRKLVNSKLAVTLIPLFILTAIVLYEGTKQIENLTIKAAQNLVAANAEKFSGYLATRKGEIAAYSTSPLLQTMDWDMIGPYYKSELQRHNNIYEKFLVGRPDAHFYNTSAGNPYLSGLSTSKDSDPNAKPKSISKRDYWQLTCGNNSSNHVVYVSEPMVSMTTGVRQIMVAATILSEGKVVGMTSGGLPWKVIERQISIIQENVSETFGGNAKFALASHSGTYFYHWDESKAIHVEKDEKTGSNTVVLTKITDEKSKELTQAGQQILKGKSGYTYYNDESTKDKMLLFYAPIESANYSLLLTIPNSYVMKPIVKARWFLAFLTLIVTVGVIISAMLLARNIANPITEVVTSISSSTNEIATTIEEHERTTMQQSAAVNQTTTTMEELGVSSRQSADQIESAAKESEMVLSIAEKGITTMSNAQEAMADLKTKVGGIAEQILQLSEQISQIGSVTSLVTDIASQVNLLALNASVEAARAGEHGKGFAVVASEIRKLADQSRKSAEKINNLVGDIQKATNSTVMVTEEGTKTVNMATEIAQEATEAFYSITNSAGKSAESVQQISMNIQQQAAAVTEVVRAMNTLNSGAKETTAGIQQVKIGINNTNSATQILNQMV